MNLDEYKSLPKIRRLAMFLLVIGPESGAPILRALDSQQREAIIQEVSELGVVDESQQQMILQEFSGFLAENLTAPRGGKEVAVNFFENALGQEEAEKITSTIGPSKFVQQVQDSFAGMQATQIWSALADEGPQVLAYILSMIDSNKSAEIFALMGKERAAEVFVRMSQLQETPTDILLKVVQNVIGSIPQELAQGRIALGGVSHSAQILKAAGGDRKKELLSAVGSVDESLGKAIAKEMFSFKDLADISGDAIQRIMREVDTSLLVVAMKSAAPELLEKIYASRSKRGAEALKEELDMQGPLRMAEVEVAQDGILDIVRKLEADGEIILDDGEEEYV
jgi:flagellar motor switch protein FliG